MCDNHAEGGSSPCRVGEETTFVHRGRVCVWPWKCPFSNSQWEKRKTSIDSCPVKKARMDIFGNPTTCKCGFHPVNVSVKAIVLNYVDKKSAN